MTSKDQARLARILKTARELELSWPDDPSDFPRDLSADSAYQELKREIGELEHAEDERLRRLQVSAIHFHDRLTRKHFYSFIVPFERLSQRTLRDDEFLVQEGDAQIKASPPVPLKIVAENIRSAFNVGTLFRTAECLGVAEILVCGYTPGPDEEKTSRTAMGTAQMVPWRRVDRALRACEELRAEGYQLVALETAATAKSLHAIQFAGKPVAFILGNERFGVEADTLQAADFICRIPVRGMKNSLNVGVAFGISAFEWLRQYEALQK